VNPQNPFDSSALVAAETNQWATRAGALMALAVRLLHALNFTEEQFFALARISWKRQSPERSPGLAVLESLAGNDAAPDPAGDPTIGPHGEDPGLPPLDPLPPMETH